MEIYGHALEQTFLPSLPSPTFGPFPCSPKQINSALISEPKNLSTPVSFLSVNLFHPCLKINSEHSYSDAGKARVHLKVTSHYGVLGGLGAMGEAEHRKYTTYGYEIPY